MGRMTKYWKRKKKKSSISGLAPNTCEDEVEMGNFLLPPNCAACANIAEHAIWKSSKDWVAGSVALI